MSVTADWYDSEKTIILMVFQGRWTEQEYQKTYTKIITMMDSVKHKINFMVDMRKTDYLTPAWFRLLTKAARYNHPNMGVAIYVGLKTYMRILGDVLFKVFPTLVDTYPVEFADTLSEADSMLAHHGGDYR